jgi:hypothetical protein
MNALSELQAKSEEIRSKEAKATLRQIDMILHKITEREEHRRPAAGRGRRIWVEIVRYLNADLSVDAEAYGAFLKVLYELTTAPELTEFRLVEFGNEDDFLCLSELSGARKNDLISLAVHYQHTLNELLLWLCRPKSHAVLRNRALRFLEVNAHGEDWHIDYDEDPIAGLRGFEEEKGPFLYFVKEVKFASVMSPICKFLMEYADDPPKPLPIRICKRSGCNKLMLPERIGRKEYCSPRCCALDHRPTPKENKDYMWLYRLSKIKSGGTLRKRLKTDPKAIKRLDQIEGRWKDEPKFAAKVEHIRARAGLSL